MNLLKRNKHVEEHYKHYCSERKLGALYILCMIKKSILVLASLTAIFTMMSCSFFKAKPQPIDLVKELDLTTIDNYPEFDTCADVIVKKQCFYNTLTNTIQQELDTITLMQPVVKKTIVMYIKINTEGVFSVEKIEAKNTLSKELILLLKNKISNLKPIKPALKQAIPTNAVFKIKVNLKSN